jgi:SAM-dependent methyltransferase
MISSPAAVALPSNRRILDSAAAFRDELRSLRAANPLPDGEYYLFETINNIEHILPPLDARGREFEPLVRGKTVLDLGCGDGDLTFFLEKLGPREIVAIDYGQTNYNQLRAFRHLATLLGSRARLIDADVHHLDFRQLPHFDTIFCLGFLYHSPHPQWILDRLRKAGDELIMTTKVFDDPLPYAYYYAPGECFNDSTNWWCLTPAALERMLGRAGFELTFMERLDPWEGKAHPVDMSRDGRVILNARSLKGAEAGDHPPDTRLELLERELAAIHGSKLWKAASFYWRLRGLGRRR